MNDRALQHTALELPASACHALLTELPRAPGWSAAMGIIDAVRQQLLGPGLLTVNRVCDSLPGALDADSGRPLSLELQRIWTSDAQAYPVAGRKRKPLTPWTRQLLVRGEPFVGEGRDALAAVFDDHALIDSLGLQSVINVPLFQGDGPCFATFNVLGRQPQWPVGALETARLLAVLSTPAVQSMPLPA